MIEKNCIARITEGDCSDAKTKIMKAGLEEFAVCSLGAARTRVIASRAGVNHAAICYYFGGKKNFYLEIIHQIADFITQYSAEFFNRAEEIYKTRSVEDAHKLIEDFISSRICPETKNNEILRYIILIITREELYQSTEAFDIFFDRVFKPSQDLLQNLVEIASRGEYSGLDAKMVSEMLIGQIHMFNSARAGFMRVNDWSEFGEREVSEIRGMFKKVLSKILNK